MNSYFSLFGFNIHFYSLCILLGIVVAYALIKKESKKLDYSEEFILNMIFYGIILGILGARIYYVLFNLDYYLLYPSEIIKIWHGGLAIHGGLIAGALFVYFYTKKHDISFLQTLDMIAPGIIIAQSIGRWGNFFNKEAYGSKTTYDFLKKLHLPEFIIKNMKINGNYYLPTFLFESIWCLIGFIFLLIIRKNNETKVGYQTSFYLIWYSFGRFFIEALRQDSLMFFNFKMAQITSMVIIIIGLFILIFSKKKNIKYRK